MENAIRKSIEGGYKGGKNFASYRYSNNHHRIVIDDEGVIPKKVLELNDILLDPLFWQALGKSCGWSEEKRCAVCNGEQTHFIPEWHYRWSRFIDHLATGGDADEFFLNLLDNK